MKNSGFSIMELIFVIAILSTLMAIATLSGHAWMERYQMEGQVKQMYADFMSARASAMQRSRMFFMTLAANQYAIYEDTYSASIPSSPDGDGILQTANDRPVTQKTLQYTLNANINIATTNVIFSANGLASPDPTTVWFTSTANPASDCITLSTTRILMGKYNGTNCVVQ